MRLIDFLISYETDPMQLVFSFIHSFCMSGCSKTALV